MRKFIYYILLSISFLLGIVIATLLSFSPFIISYLTENWWFILLYSVISIPVLIVLGISGILLVLADEINF